MNLNDAEIILSVRLPGQTKIEAVAVKISASQAESLRPLPRDRELFFAVQSHSTADRQMEGRRRIVEWAAESLQRELLKLFASRDPTNGYSPEEWAQMHPERREGE